MIRISQPAIALHSHDVPGYKYRMWQTWKMPEHTVAQDVVNWILWGINHSPEMYLDNVIINCHGVPGGLQIGKKKLVSNPKNSTEWIYSGNVGLFSPLEKRGSLGTIWLVACEVAKDSKGKQFCAELARTAGCTVIAADKVQRVNAGFYLQACPDYCIDKFEGTAFRWNSDGNQEIFSN
jgi:hypothetical protein